MRRRGSAAAVLIAACALMGQPALAQEAGESDQERPWWDRGGDSEPEQQEPSPPDGTGAPAEAEGEREQGGDDEPGGGEAGADEGEGEGGEEAQAAAPAQQARSGPPSWRWKQVLSHTRIGGRLTAVEVDPKNPRRIYVGTEEGTILRSFDGGVTWRELELRPFVVQDRQFRQRAPGLPKLGKRTRIGFTFFLDPPFRATPPDRVTLNFDTQFFSISPQFMSLGFTPRPTPLQQRFLFDVVRSRRSLTVPVKRIAVCPGAEFPLVVLTKKEVLGSIDQGLTWVRLFRLPGRKVQMSWLECSKWDSNHMMASTSIGMYRSDDGGVSWDRDMSAWPGRASSAVAFGPPTDDGSPMLYSATGAWLFAGEPGNLEWIYPDFNNTATAPWKTIRWIEITDNGDIWLATDDGIRVSHDGGESWEFPARSLFERQRAQQVLSGPADDGGERVAVVVRDCPLKAVKPRTGKHIYPRCRRSLVYSTDDGGESWHPFASDISRRTYHQMAAAPVTGATEPRWWLATSGELWATAAPTEQMAGRVIDHEAQRWARRKLERNPPVRVVVEAILDETDLSPGREREMIEQIQDRNLAPIVNAQFFAGNVQDIDPTRILSDFSVLGDVGGFGEAGRVQTRSLGGADARGAQFDSDVNQLRTMGPGAFTSDRTLDHFGYLFFIQATWVLKDTVFVREETSPTRNALHELRRQVSFIVEDAWHERKLHLQRIARGMDDPLQIAVLKERIEGLETVLETWLERPLESLNQRPRQ